MALNVKLEAFEGPLDLLLHLIEKERIDIYDIPISELTDQYLSYISEMDEAHLDLASEFLVMAATLLSIKSKMLLPKQKPDAVQLELAATREDIDPREELVNRLLEYKKYKEIAEELKNLEALQSKIFKRSSEDISFFKKVEFDLTNLTLDDLMSAYLNVINTHKKEEPVHIVKNDPIPISRKIKEIFKFIYSSNSLIKFSGLLKNVQSKIEKIVTFLAVLELIKMNKITVQQEKLFGEIIICRKRGSSYGS